MRQDNKPKISINTNNKGERLNRRLEMVENSMNLEDKSTETIQFKEKILKEPPETCGATTSILVYIYNVSARRGKRKENILKK